MAEYRYVLSDAQRIFCVLLSTNLISITNLHVGRLLLRLYPIVYAEATLARQHKSATYEQNWHHSKLIAVVKWSTIPDECKIVNSHYGLKNIWFLATWLVINDTYTDELILQYLVKAIASHPNNTKLLPQPRSDYIYSCHRHEQHLEYVLYQELSMINV